MESLKLDAIGQWLNQFSDLLDRWEATLGAIHQAYALADLETIQQQSQVGLEIQTQIESHKRLRETLLDEFNQQGITGRSFRALSLRLGTRWPVQWTQRMTALELQLNRVHQSSLSLWVEAMHSQWLVTDMLLLLSTGRAGHATYSPTEEHSLEGGHLINEAA
jgi:hypothetical protein